VQNLTVIFKTSGRRGCFCSLEGALLYVCYMLHGAFHKTVNVRCAVNREVRARYQCTVHRTRSDESPHSKKQQCTEHTLMNCHIPSTNRHRQLTKQMQTRTQKNVHCGAANDHGSPTLVRMIGYISCINRRRHTHTHTQTHMHTTNAHCGAANDHGRTTLVRESQAWEKRSL
jgi:hypothetical protein